MWGSVEIYGISIEKRGWGDVIQPEDDNKKREILLKMCDEIENITNIIYHDSESIASAVSELREKVEALRVVSYGEYVYAEHHNAFIDILRDVVNILLDMFGNIESVIEISDRVSSLGRLGFGDIVSSELHNTIVDILYTIANLLETLISKGLQVEDNIVVKPKNELILSDNITINLYYPPPPPPK